MIEDKNVSNIKNSWIKSSMIRSMQILRVVAPTGVDISRLNKLVLPNFILKGKNQKVKHFGTTTDKTVLTIVLKAIEVKLYMFLKWPPFF